MTQQQNNFLKIIRAYVNGTEAQTIESPDYIENPNWNEIYKQSLIHSLSGMLYIAVQKHNLCSDEALFNQMAQAFMLTVGNIHPVPEKVLYINEPQLADQTVLNYEHTHNPKEQPEDNIRVYVPLDLSRDAILRRLQDIYDRYGYLTEANEFKVCQEVSILVSQIEIYDQIWFVREGDCGNRHSRKATELVKDMLAILRENEGCGETFPYELVEELQSEYTLR